MWADNETNEDLLGYQVHADLLKEVGGGLQVLLLRARSYKTKAEDCGCRD